MIVIKTFETDTDIIKIANTIARTASSLGMANEIVEELVCSWRCGECTSCETSRIIKESVKFIEV